ncbi:MAG TPA: L-seryl-tRNA(Sec) selenium transferase [Candidatus Dormibacteraeota bacterium]|nr:L-seryl-tRNA(Sec) selenium transferase [Candidatus Dormibacteraeota bacterium]
MSPAKRRPKPERRRTSRPPLRDLPSVGSVLESPELSSYKERAPHAVLAEAARQAIAAARASLRGKAGSRKEAPEREAIVKDAVRRVESELLPSPRPVINATGIVLHTNLGRAVLSEEAIAAVVETARRYTNLELDLTRGARGSRMAHVEPILTELLDTEAALVVNNNAAAMLLALNTFSLGKEAIVSRGQLVEIGGSFRIPEILERAGAVLREVGTTNKTRLQDYERAIGPRTGLLLRVHPSNFAMVGFTEEATREALVALARKRKLTLLEDLGSGALIDFSRWGLPAEPQARDALRQGVPIVCFSGDKLLGGPQAGILAGKRSLIQALRANPMARALRADKLTLAALVATLRLYRDPKKLERAIPTLRMLSEPESEVRERASRLLHAIPDVHASQSRAEVVACTTEVGGGAMPLARVPSYALALRPARGKLEDLARSLRTGPDPVIGRIESGRLLLDLRTVERDELPKLAQAVVRALEEEP